MKTLRLTLFLLGFICSLSLRAQYNPAAVKPKAIALYNSAMEKVQDNLFTQSVILFKQAIKEDPNYLDAYLSLAGVYGQLKDHASSVELYRQAESRDSNYTRLFKLPYSINLAGLGEFEKAKEVIEQYLANPKLGDRSIQAGQYRLGTYRFALEMEKKLSQQTYTFTPVNLGENINTSDPEYFPSLTIDDGELVFTRRVGGRNEDFYSSRKKDTSWQRAIPLPGSLNSELNEAAQMISADGEWLVFTACHRPGGYGSCDLYISYKTPEGWSEALNLGGTINSDQWDSQPSLSPDKRELYFSSRRMGGFGGSDLYVSRLQPNGQWSMPENMGPTINTSGDEFSPFMHADNQTLYFTSNGLPGYGEADIYYIRKGPKGDWSLPQNLGYPINTIHEESTLVISSDGKTAYYASDRSDSKGGLDIYRFTLRENMRPLKTLWVKGKVFDKNTGAGLPSTVELVELSANRTISRVQTNENGEYLLTLPTGKDYAFNVNRRGYLFYSDNYLLSGVAPDSTYTKNIPLQPLEINASVVLKNIYFDFNEFKLKNESLPELLQVISLMKDNPGLRIEISGHTDSIGREADNLKLSENRARAVVQFLVNGGIKADRLVAKGYGARSPIASNQEEEGRAMNRRTEMRVINK